MFSGFKPVFLKKLHCYNENPGKSRDFGADNSLLLRYLSVLPLEVKNIGNCFCGFKESDNLAAQRNEYRALRLCGQLI